MKKILFLLAILSVGITQANNEKKDRTPEQIASIQSKKMTLVLDLDAKQQSQVEKVLLVGAKNRMSNKMSKEDIEKLTEDQKFKKSETALANKIAMKRDMKSILNADQYAKWEKMMAKRSKGKMRGRKHRKGKDEKRGKRN